MAIWSNMTITVRDLARREVVISALRTADDEDARTYTVQSFILQQGEALASLRDRAAAELKAMADNDPTLNMRVAELIAGYEAAVTTAINALEAE